MARTVTITTTTTKTLGQIAYDASDPAENRAHWTIDAERAVSNATISIGRPTNDPQQPLPVWPGVITTTRPGYQRDGAPSIVRGADGIRIKADSVTVNGEAAK